MSYSDGIAIRLLGSSPTFSHSQLINGGGRCIVIESGIVRNNLIDARNYYGTWSDCEIALYGNSNIFENNTVYGILSSVATATDNNNIVNNTFSGCRSTYGCIRILTWDSNSDDNNTIANNTITDSDVGIKLSLIHI